jgi:hypothetical protein
MVAKVHREEKWDGGRASPSGMKRSPVWRTGKARHGSQPPWPRPSVSPGSPRGSGSRGRADSSVSRDRDCPDGEPCAATELEASLRTIAKPRVGNRRTRTPQGRKGIIQLVGVSQPATAELARRVRRFLETFVVDSRLEHLRQHERVTTADLGVGMRSTPKAIAGSWH